MSVKYEHDFGFRVQGFGFQVSSLRRDYTYPGTAALRPIPAPGACGLGVVVSGLGYRLWALMFGV